MAKEESLARRNVPVKFFAAVLFSGGFDPGESFYGELEDKLGTVDYSGEDHPFDLTDYYNNEMGGGLKRRIVSFAGLGPAEDLPARKMISARIEKIFEGERGRKVNLDPGYVDYYKVVLASFKEAPQKIYLSSGVFADTVLLFRDGVFRSLPWTFPDIESGLYTDDFTWIRAKYKEERRNTRR
ncbi:MAG TPA: DUF4416 family protein [Candidatus Krumholzibacteriaceae bacterium]|nr:DUF4416 family protein [Candidatus Krumholzibacteriaceae bacterium]